MIVLCQSQQKSQKSNIILDGYGHPHFMNNFQYSKSFPEKKRFGCTLCEIYIDGKMMILLGMSIIWREVNLSCPLGIASPWPKEARTNDNDILPLFRLCAEEEAAEAALYWRWLFAWVELFKDIHPMKKILVNNKYSQSIQFATSCCNAHFLLVACTLKKTRLFSHR